MKRKIAAKKTPIDDVFPIIYKDNIKHNIARIIRLVEVDAPELIIKQDIMNLMNKYTGGTFKTACFVISMWWKTTKINPSFALLMLGIKKQLRDEENDEF